jgi:cytochrome c553
VRTVAIRIAGSALALLCFHTISAWAQENKNAAPDIVNNTCSMCHSEHGNNPSLFFVPRLAAQNAVYIKEQLEAFRDGSRADPPATMYMWPMTHGLTEDEIKQTAAWYASQAAPMPFPKEASAQEGLEIFEKGILKADVPACASCHGAKAAGTGIFPRLAGQTPQYLLAQLRYFRSGVRNDKGADVMKPIAVHLTDSQMDAVSHYLSTL